MGLRVFHVKHIEIILGLPHVAYRWCYIVSEVYEVFITASGLRRVHCIDPKLRTRQKPHRNKPRQRGGLARIDHRFGNEGDFGRPERFSESFAIDPVQVE